MESARKAGLASAAARGTVGLSSAGAKGAEARAESLSAKRRKEIAQKAAAARWGKKNGGKA